MKYVSKSLLICSLLLLGCHAPHPKRGENLPRVETGRMVRGLTKVAEIDVAFLLRTPREFRLELIEPFVGTVAIIGSDGKRMWLWEAQKGKIRSQRAAKRVLKEVLWIDGGVSDVIAIFLKRGEEVEEVDPMLFTPASIEKVTR